MYPVDFSALEKKKSMDGMGTRVFMLGPKLQQMAGAMWKETMNAWLPFSKLYSDAQRQVGSYRIFMATGQLDEENREAWSCQCYSAGTQADEESAKAIHGIHDPNMLIVFNEINGIRPAVIEGVKGTVGGKNNLMVADGNPEREGDELERWCAHPDTLVIEISGLDHPNIVLKNDDFIPGAISSTWIDELLSEPDVNGDLEAPKYISRVRGRTPVASENCLFPVKALDAVRKVNSEKVSGRWVWKEPIMAGMKVSGPFRIIPEIVYHVGINEGRTVIYHAPEHTHLNRYIISGDVAGADARGDFNAAVVWDRVLERVVATVKMHGDDGSYGKELLRLGKMYRVRDVRKTLEAPTKSREWNWPLIIWETNGVGQLHRDKEFRAYPNLYRRRNVDTKSAKRGGKIGWFTQGRSRDAIVSALRTYGYSLSFHPERIPDEDLFNDMKSFIDNGKGRYEAAPGANDDFTFALGMAIVSDQEMRMKGMYPLLVAPIEKKKRANAVTPMTPLFQPAKPKPALWHNEHVQKDRF